MNRDWTGPSRASSARRVPESHCRGRRTGLELGVLLLGLGALACAEASPAPLSPEQVARWLEPGSPALEDERLRGDRTGPCPFLDGRTFVAVDRSGCGMADETRCRHVLVASEGALTELGSDAVPAYPLSCLGNRVYAQPPGESPDHCRRLAAFLPAEDALLLFSMQAPRRFARVPGLDGRRPAPGELAALFAHAPGAGPADLFRPPEVRAELAAPEAAAAREAQRCAFWTRPR